MKKCVCLILAVLTLVLALGMVAPACKSAKADEYHIITTVFAEYDWVRNIIGEDSPFHLTLLLDSGVDLHSYQPSVADIAEVSACGLFVYVGGESDEWVSGAVSNAVNRNQHRVNLLEVLGQNAKKEELKEGMEGEAEEDEPDEHVWLSVRNAALFCREITNHIIALDEANKEVYEANLASYLKKLQEYDTAAAKAISEAKGRTLIFGDRFPFRYFVDDYNLDYFAAYSGCSAESEASFKTIKFLADKVDELGVTSVISIDGAKNNIAATVVNNTKNKNQTLRVLDSMQSTTIKDVKNGTTYLGIMEANLATVVAALG